MNACWEKVSPFQYSIWLRRLEQLLSPLFHFFISTMNSVQPAPVIPIKQKEFSRDTHLQIPTLKDVAGWSYSRIANELRITARQFEYACTTDRLTPQKKRCGRKPFIDAQSQEVLVEYVCASMRNRQMPYCQIPLTLGWNVSEDAIRRALKSQGFSRHDARRKPPISEVNRVRRLNWAIEHLD